MSNPADTSPPPVPPRRGSDAIERLYAYWIFSTVLLLLAVIVLGLYTRGALTRHDERCRAVPERLSALEQAVQELQEHALRTAPTAAAPAEPPPDRPPPPPAADAPTPSPAPPPPAAAPKPAPAAAPPAVAPPPGDTAEPEIMAQLARLLVLGDVLPLQLADAEAGRQLVATAREQASRANWSGPTWAKLAALARLVGQAGPADVFAREAHARGAPLTAYAEITARQLLAADRAEEAAPHAGYLLEKTGGAPPAALLLARVLLALGNDTEAAELLGHIDDPALLRPRERLELARAHLRLHDWKALATALDRLHGLPAKLGLESTFLYAVALTQSGERLPEALAILVFLSDSATLDAADKTDPADPIPPPRPDAYEVTTWTGVTLMRGRQLGAARQAFDDATAANPDRPEACYWRAVLELNDGQLEAAKAYLHHALAITPRHAPAWETLGGVALTSGDLDAAREYAERSLAINGRRPSTHFLLALIHATAFRRDEAATALQRTFALDPAYVEEAAQADVLRRLFTPEELGELAGARPAEPTAPPP